MKKMDTKSFIHPFWYFLPKNLAIETKTKIKIFKMEKLKHYLCSSYFIFVSGETNIFWKKSRKRIKSLLVPNFFLFSPDILKSFSIKFSKISDTIANTLFKYTCKVCVVGNWNGVSSITRFHSCFLKNRKFSMHMGYVRVFIRGVYRGRPQGLCSTETWEEGRDISNY